MKGKSTPGISHTLDALNQVFDKLDNKELSAQDFCAFIAYLYGRLWQDYINCNNPEQSAIKSDNITNIVDRAYSHGIILDTFWDMTRDYAQEYRAKHNKEE